MADDEHEHTSIDDTLNNAASDIFSVNFEILKEIINELIEQNLKRTHTHIIDKFSTKNINNDLAEELLQLALDRDLIVSYRYAQQTCYKIKSADSQTATIGDAVVDTSTNTSETYISASDLDKFKADLMKNISAVIQPPRHAVTQSPQSQQDPLVETLLKHIDFLQNTITALISKAPKI